MLNNTTMIVHTAHRQTLSCVCIANNVPWCACHTGHVSVISMTCVDTKLQNWCHTAEYIEDVNHLLRSGEHTLKLPGHDPSNRHGQLIDVVHIKDLVVALPALNTAISCDGLQHSDNVLHDSVLMLILDVQDAEVKLILPRDCQVVISN